MKVLDFQSIKEYANKMNPSEWYGWVDYTLKHKSDFTMPVKSRISQMSGNYFNIMPVLYEKENIAMVKMIGRHQLFDGEHRSSMMGDSMLYEANTGILKTVMDAEYITTLRTGVVAAHSANIFAKKNSTVYGLIGLGNIMTVCFQTLVTTFDSNNQYTIKLKKHHEQERRFADRFSYLKNVKFIFCDTYEETISDSDVVISAVTKANSNFAPDNCFKTGVTVIPICTMGFQNCDLFFDKVFTDEIDQIRGFKYFDQFKSVNNVTDVLLNNVAGRSSDKERIIIYNYGIAIHDLYFSLKLSRLIDGEQIPYRYPQNKYFM